MTDILKDECELEARLDAEFAVSEAWSEFGKLATFVHEEVYSIPTCEVPVRRYSGRVTLLLGVPVLPTVTMTVMIIGLLAVGAHFWNGGFGIFSPPSEASLDEFYTISIDGNEARYDEVEGEYDWDAGECDLVACDDFLNQLVDDDRTLDWEIAVLDTTLNELALETDADEENWF